VTTATPARRIRAIWEYVKTSKVIRKVSSSTEFPESVAPVERVVDQEECRLHLTDSGVWSGQYPGDLRWVFHRLERKGIRLYLVGPAVRDALVSGDLSRTQRLDLVAVTTTSGMLERILGASGSDNFFVSRPERFRRSVAFDIQEEPSGNALRRLVIAEIQDESQLEQELSKREVTVNALAMDREGTVLDPFGGLGDLRQQRISTILPPSIAFSQKPVNLVKIAKHVAYHGFQVSPETERHAAANALALLDVSMDRIRPEIERLLVNLYPDQGLDFLERTGILPFLFPELQSLVRFEQTCDVHHKDVWDHTKKVVARAKPVAVIRWAALFHDIGKVWTRTVDEQGAVHFFRHEDFSALLFRGIAARLELEPRFSERIRFLIMNHSRVNMYTPDWTDSAVRRLTRELGDQLADLISLSRADITSRQERRVEELTRLLDELEQRVATLKEQDEQEPLVPKGTGLLIMKHFQIPSGPLVGQLRDILEEAIADGRVPPGLPPESYLGFLESVVRKEGRTS